MALVLASCAFVIATIGLLIACLAYSEVVGLKNSTHKVTFLDPTKQMFEDLNEETRTKMQGMEPIDSMI